jgi:Arc/MetJ-type ribon-helix-helix transcriptional regulator
MIIVQLTDDLENLVRDAVGTGRYPRPDDVIRDALIRLRHAMQEGAATHEHSDPGQQAKQLTKHEFQRHLVEIGLMSEPPDAKKARGKPDDELIDKQGEIISEVVIRERLIEWLTGFL